MKYVDIRDLPPCSLSPECLRLIDDLDIPTAARSPAQLSHIADFRDERRLRQLRSHVPACPTCSALLIKARRVRTQQRQTLHHFLIANEQRVPSTTGAIFAAIRQEQVQWEEQPEEQDVQTSLPEREPAHERTAIPAAMLPVPLRARLPHQRSLFQNVVTLATVAAVVLAAVGLLNRFSEQKVPVSHPSQPPSNVPPAPLTHYGWDSVVIGLTLLSASSLARSFTTYSFNVVDNQMEVLFSSPQQDASMDLEGISDDGQSLLYKVATSDQQESYKVFSQASRFVDLYHLNVAQAGNAIWMNAESVLVQDVQGKVLQINALTGSLQKTWQFKAGELTFCAWPFLYYTSGSDPDVTDLYRVDLTQHTLSPQRIVSVPFHTRFLLSPDQKTIVYANQDAASGEEGIYAMNSDGSQFHMLRRGPGLPVGYAEDGSLMLLQQVESRLEVIKLGATAQEPEKVVLADAAPRAVSLCGPSDPAQVITFCAQNIALEPSGQGLLLHVYYEDGSHALVYDDLVRSSSAQILSLSYNASVQLPGWSKLTSAQPAASSSLARAA